MENVVIECTPYQRPSSPPLCPLNARNVRSSNKKVICILEYFSAFLQTWFYFSLFLFLVFCFHCHWRQKERPKIDREKESEREREQEKKCEVACDFWPDLSFYMLKMVIQLSHDLCARIEAWRSEALLHLVTSPQSFCDRDGITASRSTWRIPVLSVSFRTDLIWIVDFTSFHIYISFSLC